MLLVQQTGKRGRIPHAGKLKKRGVTVSRTGAGTVVVPNLDFVLRASQQDGLVSAHFCHVMQLHHFK